MFTQTFWRNTLERAAKTACQSFVAAIAASGATGATGVDWAMVGDVTILATILSFVTSVGSLPFGDSTTPNLTSER